jgi:plastocyanin
VRLAAAAIASSAAALLIPSNNLLLSPGPGRVQVSAKEFYFGLSRGSIKAGPAIVELVNFGEDDHDLRLQRIGGTRVYRTPLVHPGAYYDLELKALPGKYRLWCSIADHRALGMKAVLTVKK